MGHRTFCYREVTMKKYKIVGNLAEVEKFGPDPIILRKKGVQAVANKKFDLYKKRLDDPNYMDFAINKIAMELSHFLSK